MKRHHDWALKRKTVHVCVRIGDMGGCHCYQLADTPDEYCPTHGIPETKCYYCGRYMSFDTGLVRMCTSKAPR